MRHWLAILALGGAAVLGGGCATGGGEAALSTYRWELPAQTAIPTHPSRDAILDIDAPRAPNSLKSRAIAYQPEPHQLRFYSRSQWADTPPRMLETALVQAFERAGLFRGVVHGPSSVTASYRLSSELLRLEQDFTGEGPSVLRLALRVSLSDLNERRLLGSRVIEAAVPAPSENAEGGVQAAQQALAQAMQEVVRFAAAALPTRQ
jgi:cholesterol transport system auxiliary component